MFTLKMYTLFIICLFTFVSYTISSKQTNETNNETNNENLQIETEPVILYQKKLRNLDYKSNTFKLVTSFENEKNEFYIEIVTKFEYYKNPIESKIYRQPDKIIITPREFLEVIEFISSSIKGKYKSINSDLIISRFEQPYHITLAKPVGLSNTKYRIQVFDWMEIKDLISISSNILYDTYNYF